MNQIEKLYGDHSSPADFARGYLDYLSQLLSKLDEIEIAAFIQVLLEARDRGAQIFFIGNGGSAATASHFANDLAIGTKSWDRPFRAISLTDNVPVITAIANDDGYAEIFIQQLKTQLNPGDVVVGISASGNSENIVRAVQYAKTNGATIVGLTGFDGGKLKQLSSVNIHIQTNKGEYGPVEDIHMVIDHLVGAFLAQFCRAELRVIAS